MQMYSVVVSLHVITAVLGLGPLAALAVIASRSDTGEFPPQRATALLRIVTWSLVGILVTGVIMIAFTKGALGRTRWMMSSVILFVLLGFLLGQARRVLRRALGATPSVIPAALSRILWTMCAVVAAIVYLMEAKPM
jgi:hypothetical protein